MRGQASKLVRRRGYTLVEVMTAVAIMTVGASGIMMMQGVASRGNQQAYETTVALNVAQMWIDRVKRDSLRWTARGAASRAATLYLQDPLGQDAPTVDNWIVPSGGVWAAGLESWAFDTHGFEVADPTNPLNAGRVRYCVQLNRTLLSSAPNPTVADDDTLRVDVLVWWRSVAKNPNAQADEFNAIARMQAGCAQPLTAGEIDAPHTRHVLLSTVVTWQTPS